MSAENLKGRFVVRIKIFHKAKRPWLILPDYIIVDKQITSTDCITVLLFYDC